MAYPNTIYGKYGWEKVTTSAQKHPLGTRMELRDGRVFRYARAAPTALLDSGKLQMQKASTASQLKDLAVSAAAKGATAVTITVAGAALTANQYADGMIYVNDQGADSASGEGQVYVIKSHPAISTSTAGVITLDEEDGVADQAWTTNTQVGLRKNLFAEVEEWDASDIDGIALGVPPVRVSKTYYFWCQTWGRAAVLTGDTVILGEVVKPAASKMGTTAHGTVDGAVYTVKRETKTVPSQQEALPTVGIVDTVAASTEYSLVFLTLAP